MKRFFGILLLGLGVAFKLSAAPTSAEQLRSQLEAAMKANDTNAVLALVNWKGVSSEMKSETSQEMGGPYQAVASVKLLPLSADYQPTNEMDGVRYFPNVHVLGMIKVESKEPGNDAQIPYGESGGGFYLAGVVQETFDAHATKSKSLGVAIMCFPNKEPEVTTCSYKCVVNGKEKTDGFQCTNGWSRGFWGDYIKSCTATRISGTGSFRLIIMEGTNAVFDSDMVETNDVIAYEKKN